jgi:lysyl-tRNA synthetase class 2
MTEQKTSGLVGQREERLAKVAKLRELGIDPFPARTARTHQLGDIVVKFSELEGKDVVVAGRLMSWREHGKLAFGDLEDQSGKVQLYFREDELVENLSAGHLGWDKLNLLDVADFLEAHGVVTKTQRGEISVQVKSIRILTKSLRPLPDKWKGLSDKEDRYRRRYLDLATDGERRAMFLRKAKFWQATREYLQSQGFIEVETPVLEHKTGGADARPFETYHNDLDQKFYMRISSELFQKRLIGGGFEKVYTLGPNFRNEGVSDEHLQEYYQVEWYWAYADYKLNMGLVRDLMRHVAQAVYGKTKFSSRGHEFDLSNNWPEIDYAEIIKEKLGVDIFNDSDEKLLQVTKEQGLELSGDVNRNRLIDNLWKVIRKGIAGPAFLVNEPKFMSPLAKSRPDNPALTERFHVIIAGSELGNGYSEINDPVDQLERFLDQEKMRESGDDEAQMLDIDYVEMLEHGMPPVSGYGQSERVFWFFEDVSAREGTLFPLMRQHLDPMTKKIYGDIIREEKPADEATVEPLAESAAAEVTASTAVIDKDAKPDLEGAKKLVLDNVTDEYQRLHSNMIGTAMREYAKILAEKYPEEAAAKPEEFDPITWEITGIIHDWDYQFDPSGHPEKNVPTLTELGYPKLITDAIMGHKPTLGVPRPTRIAQALLAIDEISGLLFAYNKFKQGYKNMDLKGAKKKFKDKAFAAKVNRDDTILGLQELGMELDEHISNLIRIFAENGF